MASRKFRPVRVTVVFVLALVTMTSSICAGSGGRRLEYFASPDSVPPNCNGKCNGCTPCIAVPSVNGGPPHAGPPHGRRARRRSSIGGGGGYISGVETPYQPIIWVCKCQHQVAGGN